MSSEPQETAESSNFIAFDKTNNDDNRGYRSNFHQHRPYNRHQNYRQQNFRRNHHQQFGAAQNDGDAQFSPANFSSPVHQQRFNNRFHHRPQQMNQFQQRRNFVPFNVSISIRNTPPNESGRLFRKNIPSISLFYLFAEIWWKFKSNSKSGSINSTIFPQEYA